MTVSISGSFSASSSNTVAPSAPSTPPAAEVENKATAGSADTVKLSQAAQVHLLKQQGQGLSQIAANLGISLASVDGVLGVAVAKAPSAPSSTPAAASSQSSSTKTTPIPAKG
jgi:hypothetical protein